MREDFLHFIWKFKIFNTQQLFTSQGEPIHILKTGTHNFNAGPDFLHAQIQIGDKVWAGHVEIHVKTTDWDAHKHSEDSAYNNVILHVVYIDDRKNASVAGLPVLVLQNIIPEDSFTLYTNFLQNQKWIPCADVISQTDDFTRTIWLERMLIDRLESKSNLIAKILTNTNNDWEQTAYIWLARNFGFKTNSIAFEELASRTPYKLFAKHSNNLLQTEALLFGQSGFLEDDFPEDNYYNKLKDEYNFLAKKYDLTAMQKENWKFMRMHPGNFPTIRIAQFAALLHKTPHLLSEILKIRSLQKGLYFFDAQASDYWKDHLLFGKEISKKQNAKLGKDSSINILINTVAPLQFCYGEMRSKPQLNEQAQDLLLELPAENNNITRGWLALGFKNDNAFASQSLIQLKNNYCEAKKCLHCSIGTQVLKGPKARHKY